MMSAVPRARSRAEERGNLLGNDSCPCGSSKYRLEIPLWSAEITVDEKIAATVLCPGGSANYLHGFGRIWTRPRWQDSGELLRDKDRCMRISGFFLKARLAFEP
jgi:hypothetical protein